MVFFYRELPAQIPHNMTVACEIMLSSLYLTISLITFSASQETSIIISTSMDSSIVTCRRITFNIVMVINFILSFRKSWISRSFMKNITCCGMQTLSKAIANFIDLKKLNMINASLNMMCELHVILLLFRQSRYYVINNLNSLMF